MHHKPGDILGNLQTLANRFGVSVATIRNALLLLAKDGIVESIHGSGTYVKDSLPHKHVAVITQMDAANFHKPLSVWFLWILPQE